MGKEKGLTEAEVGQLPGAAGQTGDTGVPEMTPEYQSDVDRMKAHLASQPKRSVFVPSSSLLAQSSAASNFVLVTLNGYVSYVPIDEQADVPEGVALVIEESLEGEKKNAARVKELAARGVIFNV